MRKFRGVTGLASIYPISPREKRAPFPPRSHGAGTGLAVNTRGNPTYSLTPPLFPQISRVHGVEMEKPNHSKGKISPVSPRSHGADTGLAVTLRGNPTYSLTHPLFPQISRVYGVEMKKLNPSKGKTRPVSPRLCGAGTGLGSIFTGSDRVATGAAICSLTFPALSSCRANQAKAR